MGAIYKPKGKAAEYSKWAANFYNYCSGGCTYCYLNEKPLSLVRTKEKSLKKCFRNELHAFDVFNKELLKNKIELQRYGLFFNFNSDPFLKESINLNWSCIRVSILNYISVKVLTKQTWFLDKYFFKDKIKLLSVGFTLTGHDELEPGCATNAERIEAMKILKERGFKTWASIEPVVSIDDSLIMIMQSLKYCDHYKIGLFDKQDQKKYLPFGKYEPKELKLFIKTVSNLKKTIYWKDDLLKQAGINREDLPSNCVGRDYL